MSTYCLHGFLGLPTDWDPFAFTNKKAISMKYAPFWEWAANFNRQVQGKDNILIGYSFGGRLALHALIDDPTKWKKAVLVSTHPGLRTEKERTERRQKDEEWAQRFLEEPWDEVMKAWNGQNVFKGTKDLKRKEKDYDRQELANQLLGWSTGLQDDLQEQITRLQIPLLWITGEEDTKFTQLIPKQQRSVIIPQAGHRAPWDQPKLFNSIVNDFMVFP